MAKRTPTPRRPIVALDDLAPQRELRAGTGRRVFGADPTPTRAADTTAVVAPASSKRRPGRARG